MGVVVRQEFKVKFKIDLIGYHAFKLILFEQTLEKGQLRLANISPVSMDNDDDGLSGLPGALEGLFVVGPDPIGKGRDRRQ